METKIFRPTYKLHSINHYRRAQTIDIKLLPYVFNFYLAHIESCGIKLNVT